MAGYSSRSQAAKLGLKPGYRIAVENRPDGWDFEEPPDKPPGKPLDEPLDEPLDQPLNEPRGDPPDGTNETGIADVIIAFFDAAAEIPVRLPVLAERVYPAGAIWVAWPRRAAGHKSDITDNVIREHALPLGLVDVKVAAIDNDWSGLRLVWRVANRTRS
jgi:hypothetical protein